MNKVRPTLKTIAGEAGCSIMTVSLALRNHPRISKETQDRVRDVADRLGYRANPMVASLMTHIRLTRPIPYQANLALFTFKTGSYKDHPMIRAVTSGVSKRAEDLGFLVDFFDLDEPKMRFERLERVLDSRNIQAVILAPLPESGRLDELNWSKWSSAALGNSLLSPRLHRITHHQYHGMSLILEKLQEKGYRRIGLVIDRIVDDKVDRTFTSCVAGYQLRQPVADRVPVYLSDPDPKLLASWLKKYKPEVVVGHDGLFYWLQELNVRVPEDVAFAHVSLPSKIFPNVSGLDQNWPSVGAAAVDSVVAQLYRNERGIPENPKTIMLEGSWVEGTTTPGPTA